MNAATEVTKINGRRCTGHCCRDFYLPWQPEDLKRVANVEIEQAHGGKPTHYDVDEIALVAGMVIPLPFSKKLPDALEGGGYRYTCRFHNKETGDCGIYLTRPRMCSTYPYGKTCTYEECNTHAWYRRYTFPRYFYKLAVKLKEWRYRRQLGKMKLQLDVLRPAQESGCDADLKAHEGGADVAQPIGEALASVVPEHNVSNQEGQSQTSPEHPSVAA